jgi:hypothetical protein
MSEILAGIVDLVRVGEVRISAHSYDEIVEDGILAGEVIDGVEAAGVIEEYPTYAKGPCVLVLQRDRRENAGPRSVGHPAKPDIAGRTGNRLSARSRSLECGFPAEEAMRRAARVASHVDRSRWSALRACCVYDFTGTGRTSSLRTASSNPFTSSGPSCFAARRPDHMGWHQDGAVAMGFGVACPVVRRATRLHEHRRARLLGEEASEALTRQPVPFSNLARLLGHRDLEHRLRCVDRDRR